MRCWRKRWRRWRVSLAYDGERADAQVLDQLETILRHVADELAGWRARAVKAEAELKESSGRGGSAAKPDAETRNRVADLEQENKTLRQRVEDRKSTRLNSSHRCISYAVFCLKKKNKK